MVLHPGAKKCSLPWHQHLLITFLWGFDGSQIMVMVQCGSEMSGVLFSPVRGHIFSCLSVTAGGEVSAPLPPALCRHLATALMEGWLFPSLLTWKLAWRKLIKAWNMHCTIGRTNIFATVLTAFSPSVLFQSCQADLVKDNGHKYFLSVLADPYMPVRTNHLYSGSSSTCSACQGLYAAFWHGAANEGCSHLQLWDPLQPLPGEFALLPGCVMQADAKQGAANLPKDI